MKTPEKGFIKLHKKTPEFLRNNFGRKLMALLLALLIHGVVKAKYFSEERTLEVPVEITLPEGICSTSKSTPVVNVILRGSTSALNRLVPGDITIKGTMSADDYKDGQPTRLSLESSWLDIPAGVRLRRFEPAEITLRHLERIDSKEVPVVPAWADDNDDEYGFTTVFTPSHVAVNGPSSLLANIDRIYTVPMKVSNVPGEKTIDSVELDVPANASLSTEEVVATVQVSLKNRTKSFNDLPVFILFDSGDNNKTADFISDENVTVVLAGSYSDLQSISASQLRPCLDISILDTPGEYEAAVSVTPPHGTKVESVYPESLKIKISFREDPAEKGTHPYE